MQMDCLGAGIYVPSTYKLDFLGWKSAQFTTPEQMMLSSIPRLKKEGESPFPSLCWRVGERRGFALVVSLVLMAFLLLLMLSLSTLLQVEIQASSVATRQVQARENAILGLQIALGQLQELVGPDQRVTARADILSTTHPDKRFWTGVWRSDDNAGPVDWLVSWPRNPDGSTSLPSASGALPNDSSLVELVGGGSAEDSVRVVKVAVNGTNSSSDVTGHYAYWVSDEGIKAKINLANEYAGEDIRSDNYRAGLKTAQRNAGEQMPGLVFLGEGDAEIRDELLSRLNSGHQLDLVARALGEGDVDQGMRRHFFDYTVYSNGVLTNVRDGGLKIDLTRALQKKENSIGPYGTRIFDRGPSWTLLQDYYWNLRTNPDNPQINPIRRPMRYAGGWDPGTYVSRWPASHGVAPIIVASELAMGVIYNYDAPLVQDRAVFTMAPVLVLANPYDVRLNPARYIVRYSSYNSNTAMLTPQVDIKIGAQTWERLHINQILPPNANGARGSGNNDLRFIIDTGFEPGEIKIFTLKDIQQYETLNPPVLEEGYNADAYAWVDPNQSGVQLTVPARSAGDPPAKLQVLSRSLYRSMSLYLYHDASVAFDSESNLIFIQPYMAPFGSAQFVDLSLNTDKQVREFIWLKGSTSNDSFTKNGPVYGLAHFNVRAYRHISFFENTGHFASAYLYGARADYGDNSQFNELALWEPDALIGMNNDVPRYAMPLFHLLRTNEIWQSLAELQHVDFSLHSVAPAYAVGNSWAHPFIDPGKVVQVTTEGGTTAEWMDMSWQLNNALWDNYFFSTLLDPDDAGSPNALRNPRMRLNFEELTDGIRESLDKSDQAAAWFTVDGAFNVNSTSPEAWMAVLSGNHGMDVAYTDLKSNASGEDAIYEGEKGVTAFLRSVFPMGEHSSNEKGDFWRGFGVISNESPGANSPSPLRKLAEAIVDEVKKRGPFRSLSDFVNRRPGTDKELALRGALQAAIDRSGINTEGRPEQRFGGTLPSEPKWNFPEAVRADNSLAQSGFRGKGAPGYITQADILTAIGPYLSVRSDTFVIRAYGDVTSPLDRNTVLARAWCEAVVQRVPDYVDSANPPWMGPKDSALTELNKQMGRKFEIVSFRWLKEDEI